MIEFSKTSFWDGIIELINPKYFCLCHHCNKAGLLHRSKPISLYKNKLISTIWVCHYCGNQLVVKRLKKYKSLEDIKKQVLAYIKNEKSSEGRNSGFGIFK